MSLLATPPDPYRALCDQLGLHAGIPAVDDWTAAPDFLQLIVDTVQLQPPATILECGSGLTTLMLAKSCQLYGNGQVISLENSQSHAEKTQQSIDACSLSDYLTVIHAPLLHYNLAGEHYQWYALDDLPDNQIDMLVIDGPPGFIQKNSRYPALPLLFDRLSMGCKVFMDDAARADELEIVNLWKTSFPDIKNDYIKTDRGCARMTIHKV